MLWQHGPGPVRQVQQALEAIRPTGYTTVLKLMQIMTEKGLVVRDESQRAHVPLVHVAPHPALARLDRLHDGVPRLLKVPRGVLVLRRVATADVAARLAHP